MLTPRLLAMIFNVTPADVVTVLRRMGAVIDLDEPIPTALEQGLIRSLAPRRPDAAPTREVQGLLAEARRVEVSEREALISAAAELFGTEYWNLYDRRPAAAEDRLDGSHRLLLGWLRGDRRVLRYLRVVEQQLQERLHAPQRRQETAAEREQGISTSWGSFGLGTAEEVVWRDAGIRRADAHLARQCVDHGISPAQLSIALGGMTVLELLEAGEPADVIAKRLHTRAAASA